MIKKNPNADLKKKYHKVFEASLALALLFHILVFYGFHHIHFKEKAVKGEIPKIKVEENSTNQADKTSATSAAPPDCDSIRK